MDNNERRDFFAEYQQDPVGTWRRRAEATSDPEAKTLYLEFARSEESKREPTDQTSISEGTELHKARTLMELAHQKPSLWERIRWLVSDLLSWTHSLLAAARRPFNILLRTISGAIEELSGLIVDHSGLWVLLFGTFVFFQVLGAPAKLLVVIALVMSGILLSIEWSRWKTDSIINHTVVFLWFGLLGTTSLWTTVASPYWYDWQSDTHQPQDHSYYVIRSGAVMDLVSFSAQDRFRLKFVNPGRPFLDDYQRLDMVERVADISFKTEDEPSASGAKKRHTHTVTLKYFLDPQALTEPFPVGESGISSEVNAVDRLIKTHMAQLARVASPRVPSHEEFLTAIKEIDHSLFRVHPSDIEINKAGLELYVDGEWYEVNRRPAT